MKKLLYIILGLVALYMLLCFFGPSHVKMERSIEINASKELVQAKLADLKFFHDEWSPWTEKDTAAKTTYAGEMGQPGSSYAWDSQVSEVGKGMMIYDKTVGDSILMTLRFDGMGDSKVYFITTATNNATNVVWGMAFDVGFFGRGFMLFMNFEKQMAPDYEKGLNSMKKAMETAASNAVPAYEVKEIQWDAKTFYGVKQTLSADKLAGFFGESYGKLGAALGKAKVQFMGAPKAIYFSFDEKTMITECAAVVEVPSGTKLEGFEKYEIPAGKVLQIEYYGAYEKTGAAHYAMDDYLKKNGLKQGYVFEEYVTDPMVEKDTAKWLTNIYYTLQ